MDNIQYGFLRAIATGCWIGLLTSGVHGWPGILLAIISLAGLVFTWTYKTQPPRRIR